MPVDFEELEGSPKISVSRRGMSGVRVFKINWSDWPDFLGELWGYWVAVGGQSTYTPAASFYGLPGMWPSDIQVDPFQPDSPLESSISLAGSQANYNYARVTVTYKPFPVSDRRMPQVPNGTFLIATGDVAAQYMALPGRTWKWPDGTTVEDDFTPGILIPEESINLSWRWVPQPPWTAMRQTRGCVNNSTFMGYDAEQVLFVGANWEREFQVNDTPLWRVDYKFQVKTVQSTLDPGTVYGHNYFYRRDAGAGNDNWQRIVSVQTGAAPFQSADLSQLFQFGS
jgi:hypothetical protein